MAPLTRRLSIHGRVQGVGFRWALAAQATAQGLTGWVRNRRDGSVEALVCGAPAAVATLTAWAQRGPPGARVERVVTDDAPDASVPEALTGFERRATF